MTTEFICTIISVCIITAYLLFVSLWMGIPPSISETYYHRLSKWLFPICLVSAGAFATVPLLNNTPEDYQFVAFFIIASILFVAAAPAFKEEFEGKVHYGAAVMLGLSALEWMILTTGMPWIALAITLCCGVCDRKRFLFWFEVGLLYNLYASLLYTLLT